MELSNKLLNTYAKGGNCNIIQKTANIEIKNRHGFNTLHYAIAEMNYSVIKELLRTSISLDTQEDFDGRTALHHAVLANSNPIITLFINAGASVYIVDHFGFTALHLAAQNNYTNIVKDLLDAGANIDTKDINGHTPLHLAAERGKFCTVKFLLERGANKEIIDNEGHSALDLAMSEDKIACAKYLDGFTTQDR